MLGGFVAPPEAWAQFEREWRIVLDSEGLAYFKMNEAARLRDQFEGWNEPRRDAMLLRLAAIIRRRALIRVHASISHAAFNALLRSIPTPGRRLMGDHPYPLLFSGLLLDVACYAPFLGAREPVDFTFDEQSGFSDDVLKTWPQHKANAERIPAQGFPVRLGAMPVFANDKSTLPLQAADLYAWHVRHGIRDRTGLWLPPSPVMREFIGMKTVGHHVTEAELHGHRAHLLETGRRVAAANPGLKFDDYISTSKGRRKMARRRQRAGR